MKSNTLKKEINQILDTLPEEATWDDLMYKIYIRQAIEKGLKDSREGKTLSTDEVRTKFGLSK